MTTDPTELDGARTVEERPCGVTIVKETAEPVDADDLRQIVLRVGPGGGRQQRFVGRLLGESREYTKVGMTVVRVYVSRRGKFVVHRRESDWREMSVAIDWTEWKNWRELLRPGSGEREWGDYTVEIVDSPTALRGRIPEHIYRTVVDVAENPTSQDLQI
ncbi:EXLDI protein [Nocardia beijingensis]|uniref:EXLDI protein n=1 Tax=Nocardia beijingensis TaxID=95162 RepID=UPI00189565C3|nr:EXLDI protein [Nocardia beijingensis]MBF6464923.1 EXLDI protein [Nocardia beijingensis]